MPCSVGVLSVADMSRLIVKNLPNGVSLSAAFVWQRSGLRKRDETDGCCDERGPGEERCLTGRPGEGPRGEEQVEVLGERAVSERDGSWLTGRRGFSMEEQGKVLAQGRWCLWVVEVPWGLVEQQRAALGMERSA